MATEFVRSANPIWYFPDLVGLPLNDTYYFFTLTNTLPYLPQTVYKTFSGTPWSNPIEFLPNGTLPDNIFWDDSLVYRLEVRDGPTQSDQLIYEIENYVPGGGGSSPVDAAGFSTDNQVTNPQFSVVNFNINIPFIDATTPPSPIQIAPGWELAFDGGVTSVTVAQISNTGSEGIVTNPPYALSITAGGSGNVTLRQKFLNNGALWAGIGISVSYVASGILPINIKSQITYSDGSQTVNSTHTLSSAFQEFDDPIFIPSSSNTQDPSIAFTALEFVWPAGTTIEITSIQVIAQNTTSPVAVAYQQESVERQTDNSFHYYKQGLLQKPIPSVLTGWDFPLNPAQINGTTVAAQANGVNSSYYVWDQTIVYQSITSGLTIARGTVGEFVMTAAATGQFGLVQYLGPRDAKRLLTSPMAVNIAAFCSAASGIECTVQLWYFKGTNLPHVTSVGTWQSIIDTLNADGSINTQNGTGTWVEVPRTNNIGKAQFLIGQNITNKNFFDYNFSGWDASSSSDIANATFFAITIGTASVTMGTSISFNSIALCSGTIATRPAPKTLVETLLDCQHYFESSYPIGTAPAALLSSERSAPMYSLLNGSGATPVNGTSRSFGQAYAASKRTTPTLTFYSPVTGASANVTYILLNQHGLAASIVDAPITNWTVAGASTVKAFFLQANSSTVLTTIAGAENNSESFITYHYTSNAQLGVVD